MKKVACLLRSVVMTATTLTGCGSQQDSNKENTVENVESQAEKKEKVEIACWGNQMLDTYSQYLCEQFPEVEFEFVLATNSTD